MQDDFVILHVSNSYDSLIQIPFKTEFVTTLKKLKEAQGLTLRVVCHNRYDNNIVSLIFIFSYIAKCFKCCINHRIDFTSDKKSMGAGKKRTITFTQGGNEQETIEAKGMLKSDLAVYVNQGLPNTSSKQIFISTDIFQSIPPICPNFLC